MIKINIHDAAVFTDFGLGFEQLDLPCKSALL